MWIVEGLTDEGVEVLAVCACQSAAQAVFDVVSQILPAVTMHEEDMALTVH